MVLDIEHGLSYCELKRRELDHRIKKYNHLTKQELKEVSGRLDTDRPEDRERCEKEIAALLEKKFRNPLRS